MADIVNCCLATVALIVSGVIAWHQLDTPSDMLNGVEASFDRLAGPLKHETRPILFTTEVPLNGEIAPVQASVQVYNPMDRNVSVTSIRLFQVFDKKLIFQSNQLEWFSITGSVSEKTLPFSVPARTTVSIRLAVRLPVSKLEGTCGENIENMQTLETCVAKSGSDIFGNRVEQRLFDGEESMRSWPDGAKTPSFLLELTTADGSNIHIPFSYYPEEVGIPF